MMGSGTKILNDYLIADGLLEALNQVGLIKEDHWLVPTGIYLEIVISSNRLQMGKTSFIVDVLWPAVDELANKINSGAELASFSPQFPMLEVYNGKDFSLTIRTEHKNNQSTIHCKITLGHPAFKVSFFKV